MKPLFLLAFSLLSCSTTSEIKPEKYSVSEDFDLPVATLQFKFNSAEVEREDMAKLLETFNATQIRKGGFVAIEGHSDSSGEESYNKKLSLKRAEAVKDILVNQAGVDPRFIIVTGSGSEFQEGDSEEARRTNRRVEITFEYRE